ncbi:hypothetical protein GDO86_003333, partial [Hymenochirus boettgeri]
MAAASLKCTVYTFRYGPVFEDQPQNTLFPEGFVEEQVTLSCRARASPSAIYRWKLNGTELNLSANSSYQLVGGNLAISNPTQAKHAGTYQCVASNPKGTVLSNEASLRFGYLHEFPVTQRDPVKVTEGWGIMLPCNPPQHYPGLFYRWLLNEFPSFLNTDSRRFVSQGNGNLYIAHTEESDEGRYSCLTTSHISFTTKSVYSSFLPLSVISEADPRMYSPSIKLRFPSETYTLHGQAVTLECFAFGNPVPQIRWRKVEGTQPPRWLVLDPVLHFPSITFEDDGTYECEAENSRGRDILQGRVIVQAQPEWLQVITNTEAKIGSDLIWSCAASGKPRPTIRWLGDGKPLTSQHLIVTNGQLKFTNLSLSDSGMYQCVAGNKHGTIYTSAELTVQALAPDFSLSPVKRLIPAARGGEVIIQCNPQAAPTPLILWTKGTELLQNNKRVTITANGTLILKNISRSDEGKYTCFAENIMGKSNSTGVLNVREATKITLAPSGSDINQGENVTLQCHAFHDPSMDLTFTWTLNGIPIDFEKEAEFYKRISVNNAIGDIHIIHAQLRHAGKYTCTAQTVVDRISASTSLLIRGPPGPPGGVVVKNIWETTVQLSWSRGFDNYSPTSRYVVQVRKPQTKIWRTARTDPPTVEGNAETALVVGLSPWTEYLFRVEASNILGVGVPSCPSALIRTKEAAPNVAPSGVSGGGGAPNELIINWMPIGRQYQNGDGFGYVIAFKKKSEDIWQTISVPGVQSHQYVYRNESIAAYTPFDVKIKGFNKKGQGPYSREITVYSAEEEPNVFPNEVKAGAKSSSDIEVTWNTAEAQNGVVLGYEIRYWKSGDKEAAADRVRSAGMIPVAIVGGLRPDTTYYITVRSYNRAGTGPSSPITNVTTPKAPPNRRPENITWAMSRKSLRIKWDPVTSLPNESFVTGYKVLYRLDLHSTPTLYVTSKTYLELPLPEGTSTVTIQLRTTGQGGDGEPAEAHIPTDT